MFLRREQQPAIAVGKDRPGFGFRCQIIDCDGEAARQADPKAKDDPLRKVGRPNTDRIAWTNAGLHQAAAQSPRRFGDASIGMTFGAVATQDEDGRVVIPFRHLH